MLINNSKYQNGAIGHVQVEHREIAWQNCYLLSIEWVALNYAIEWIKIIV